MNEWLWHCTTYSFETGVKLEVWYAHNDALGWGDVIFGGPNLRGTSG